MEVGAVKQAFNNEVILLKKKLNQAKIQVIHKLTRKAKTLTEKKVPEKVKAKFTKKAESAVKEVLIIKKIKARDVAKFIVTHRGQLNEYLNKPTVDSDKACARLLLHKVLQDKYKIIRDRFSNISIEDLLMSRQERRKLKKEAREKQKSKKKGKDVKGPVQAEGDWNVEDIDVNDDQLNEDNDLKSLADENDLVIENGIDNNDAESDNDDDSYDNVVTKPNFKLKNNGKEKIVDNLNDNSSESNDNNDVLDKHINEIKSDNESSISNDSNDDTTMSNIIKNSPRLLNDNDIVHNENSVGKRAKLNEKVSMKQTERKHKESSKNKNLKNKILSKNFKKEKFEVPIQESKVVDPFFITATGDNYMSVAEARPPDEVKEVHKQGNRKYRRAVMFGIVPKAKPRRNDFRADKNNARFSKFESKNNSGNFNSSFKNNNGFEKHGAVQKKFDKYDDSSNRSNFKDRSSGMKNIEENSKPEKLHPSWEAKKRQSGILPFQGKKIVFDEG